MGSWVLGLARKEEKELERGPRTAGPQTKDPGQGGSTVISSPVLLAPFSTSRMFPVGCSHSHRLQGFVREDPEPRVSMWHVRVRGPAMARQAGPGTRCRQGWCVMEMSSRER